MKRLIFATNNRHKVEEVRAALGPTVQIVTLREAGLEGEIPETADTLEGNALQKVRWVQEHLRDCSDPTLRNLSIIADDTGLEVEALDGAPGVYSARYAGEHCSFDDNIDKLLAALDGKSNRRARFRTVICLIDTGAAPVYFEGRVDGQILTERHTHGEGFGYDPIFMPDRFAVSFAEMPLEVKNRISHRGLAVQKLKEWVVGS